MKNFFEMSINEVLHEFNSSENGLSNNQVKQLREKYGFNLLRESKKESVMDVFLNQFKDFLVVILIIAGLISIATDNVESTLVIFTVIFINAILGTVQYFKAVQSLESLKALSSPASKVIRNGEKIQIKSKDIVPGDILVLEAGDLITADGRIIESYSLQVNESSLTGESVAVEKTSDLIEGGDIPLADKKNMVFSGSLVTYGRGALIVTATGMETEMGKIANLMENTQKRETPLQVTLDEFSKKLAIGIFIICILILALSIYRGNTVLDSLMFAVALAVAAIPEALSSIVTIVLAIGTQKMAKENAIVKEIKAVEGLGSVSVICSDKTGTLTQNKMTVKKVFVDDKEESVENLNYENIVHKNLIMNAILCNDSSINNGQEIGDPTEVALITLARKIKVDEVNLREKYNRLQENPFDSDRKLMSTLHFINNKNILFVKGAPDVLLNKCKFTMKSSGVAELNYEERQKVIKKNKSFSENGLRVLAFAYKNFEHKESLDISDEENLIFLGLIAMIDPPRDESKEAVKHCIEAGIKPVMITGDHKITASAIAREIGILNDGDIAVNGSDIDKLDDDELKEKVKNISVYARVSPEHKIRIVNAWQRRGEIVAMTGDGVNDAPALKQADIGIAMGITGTEVSKDASSVILTDDNFATIVKAVSDGRSIYSNIKNSIKFLLSGNTSGIISVVYASLMALQMPFAAVHLLFINLLTDSLPAIAIGMEKSNEDLLKEKPRGRNESILNKAFLLEVIFEGILISIFTLIAFYFSNPNSGYAQTMAFSTLCLARLFHGFNCRGKGSIFKLGVISNKYSIVAFIFGVLFLNMVLFLPFLQPVFDVANLSFNQYKIIVICAFMPTLIIQVIKVIRDNFFNKVKKFDVDTKPAKDNKIENIA